MKTSHYTIHQTASITGLIKKAFRKLGYEIRRLNKIDNASIANFNKHDYYELSERYQHYQPLKLHFGCGPRVLKGWVNIDLKYVPFENYMKYYGSKYYPQEQRGNKSDLYAFDVTKSKLPLPDNCVDVIFHEDFLEHLSQMDQIIFLAESLRVLKKDAVHRVNTPNLLISMKEKSTFTLGKTGVYVDEWYKHGHLNLLTPNLLEEMAMMVGYSKVLFTGRDETTSKLIPLEYRPDPKDRPEYGNIFADLIK
jgi:predicted SAM-dependent methyltransferase